MPVKFAACILAIHFIIGCSHSPDLKNSAEQPAGFFVSPIRFYQGPLNHLEAVRHGECPMYPSCSQYAEEAIRKHGPAVGWMMAFDRLLRCGRDELKTAPRVFIDGKWRYYDPVEENDFW